MSGPDWLGAAICVAVMFAVAYAVDRHDQDRRGGGRR